MNQSSHISHRRNSATLHRRQSQLCFSDPAEAERIDAIERLHAATAIYTAQPVVDDLLDRLGWPDGNSLLDPACGDGMFLVRALERLLERGKPEGEISRLVQGWEVHPGACSDARNRLTGVLMSYGYSAIEAGSISQRMVINRDFLIDGPTEPMTACIAGNPPFLRNANVPTLLREEYTRHVPDYANADLLHSFLERCSRAIYPDGQIGFVTSDRWLIGQQASRLREKLGERLSLSHLERLDVNSAFYRAKQRRAGTPPRIHPVSVVLNGGAAGRSISHEPIYAGVDPSKYEGLPILSQFAKVRIAPWLGSFGVFVVDAITAKSLPSDWLVPVVDTEDIFGATLKASTRFAIRTSPDLEPPGAIMDHLQRNMHRMAERGRKGSKPWMPPESFHNWDFDAPSLIVPRIAKSPKAVRVPPNVLPINHNLSVVSGDATTLDAVEAALSSDLSAQWVGEHAPRLENSYFSLTTTLLRKMPVVLPADFMR